MTGRLAPVEAHEAAVAVNPNWRFALGATYLAAGRRADALRILREVEAGQVSSYGAFQRAWLNTVLGNLDEAFRWWAYEPHHAWVAWIVIWPPPEIFPEANRLREDPRFQELLGRMGLPTGDIAGRSNQAVGTTGGSSTS